MLIKIGSIIGAAAALAGAIALALKAPTAARESQQTVTNLAPVAESGISFSR